MFPISMTQVKMSQYGDSRLIDFSPLQKGDRDIFIKEEFVDLKEPKWVDGVKRRYIYNNTFCEDD